MQAKGAPPLWAQEASGSLLPGARTARDLLNPLKLVPTLTVFARTLKPEALYKELGKHQGQGGHGDSR